MNVSKPKMSELLASVATTATVQTKSIGLRRIDKKASIEADRAHNARTGAGKLSVSRLSGAEDRVKNINDKATEAQETLKSMTTAWGDRRLLANTNLDEWLKQWTKIKKEYDTLVEQFKFDAPRLIQEAEFNKGDYAVQPPTMDEIEKGFDLRFKLEAIAKTDDVHPTGLSAQMENALKRRLEAEVEAAYQLSQRDALQRVAEPLGRMVERLQAYSEKEEAKLAGKAVGRGEGSFRDTLTENVEKIATVFRSFNLAGDPIMDKLADQLDALTGIEAQDLRDNRKLREDTAARAKAILEEIGVYQP